MPEIVCQIVLQPRALSIILSLNFNLLLALIQWPSKEMYNNTNLYLQQSLSIRPAILYRG